jgi:hypothetical protein
MVHASLHWSDHGVDDISLWPFAVKHAVWLHNRVPNRESGLTPLELVIRCGAHVGGAKSNVFNHSLGLKNSRFALIFRYIPYIPFARTIILKAGTKKECVSFCYVRRNCL